MMKETAGTAFAYLAGALVITAVVCGEGLDSAAAATPVAQSSPSASAPPNGGRQDGLGSLGVAERGRANYATYCAPCHGPRGGGDGPLARIVVPKPVRHNDAAFMSALSDEYLFRLLKYGGPAHGKSPAMGVFGRLLSDEQIRDLIAFVRTLAQ